MTFCFVFLWLSSIPKNNLCFCSCQAGQGVQPPQFNASTLPVLSFAVEKTVLCPNLGHVALWYAFDSTLGYAGEGPPSENMSFVSANMGSFRTNHMWKSWNADARCLQETRIAKSHGLCMLTSDPHLVQWNKAGNSMTPWPPWGHSHHR